MNKNILKIINVFLIISIFFVNFLSCPKAYAKTVRDLQNELDNLQKTANDNSNKIKYTEAQINQAKKDNAQIGIDMDNISAEIIQKNKEIDQLNVDIKTKDEEAKKIMEFVQLSNGYSFYLKYITGAESLTDLIYRMSVAEQLSEYNSSLIKQMNEMIKTNENRKIELSNKTKELERKQVELASNLKILANQKIQLDEYDRSLSDEISVARETLKMYREAGCTDNEDLVACANRILPSDTGFARPLIRGYVTSEYSLARVNPVTGKVEPHAAMDLSNSDKSNTMVYPVANGKVANVFYDKYGGNEVIIHHKIKSGSTYRYYSSTYLHLAAVYVKIGQAIFDNTPLGKMGSTGLYTTGAHLHLAISTGLRYKDYVSYNDFVAHCINPRLVISFPSYRTAWYGR